MIAERPRDWANLVRARRKEIDKTQEEIAKEIGVSRQWVSNFENGRSTGSARLADTLQLLAAVGLFTDIMKEEI